MRKSLIFTIIFVLVGILAAPYVFAETDDDTILYLCCLGDDDWTIELPSDGSWVRGSTETVVFQTPNGESIIRILYLTFLTDQEKAKTYGEATDRDILNAIKLGNNRLCSEYYWEIEDPPFNWYGCFKFQDLGKETTYTNEGRKLQMMDMEYTTNAKIHSIDARIFDGRDFFEITSRTIIDGSKADPETLQQIKEIIKSLVILNPNTKPELEPEPELQTSIPDWIKSNAGWWANGQIDDATFLQGISHLIQNNIIVVPAQDVSSESSGTIPDWVKNNAGWWATDQIKIGRAHV